jgi:hypothetical protein
MNQTTSSVITPKEMLLAINDYSQNEISKRVARKILLGQSSVEEEIEKNHGRFLTSVLKGDFETALGLADSTNKQALETLIF